MSGVTGLSETCRTQIMLIKMVYLKGYFNILHLKPCFKIISD